MALAVVHRRRVGQDLAAGFDYYAAQGPELGEKFLRAVTSVPASTIFGGGGRPGQ